jgi:DNA-binding ferritin-like protein
MLNGKVIDLKEKLLQYGFRMGYFNMREYHWIIEGKKLINLYPKSIEEKLINEIVNNNIDEMIEGMINNAGALGIDYKALMTM